MTTETNAGSADQVNADAGNKSADVGLTLEQALDQLKAEKAKSQDVILSRDKAKLKLREIEEAHADTSKKYQELFAERTDLFSKHEAAVSELTSLKEGAKTQLVNSALEAGLQAAGFKAATATGMKLVDKSKLQFGEDGKVTEESVMAAIKEIQDLDPNLFGEAEAGTSSGAATQSPKGPLVRRAGEAETQGAYEKEMAAAKTAKEIREVFQKYHPK